MEAVDVTWIYQFFSWYCNCENVTERVCSVKTAAFLTELAIGKFSFSHFLMTQFGNSNSKLISF